MWGVGGPGGCFLEGEWVTGGRLAGRRRVLSGGSVGDRQGVGGQGSGIAADALQLCIEHGTIAGSFLETPITFHVLSGSLPQTNGNPTSLVAQDTH